MRKMTTEEFIRRAQEIHGDNYDYSKTEYKGYNSKVTFYSEEFGEMVQPVSSHLKGCTPMMEMKDTKESFIEKAIKIHGEKYDYSLVEYVSSETKVKIICPHHNVFEQTPYHHLKGHHCGKCRGRGMSTEDFVKRASKIHDGFYDYSKTVYIRAQSKVMIICPNHMDFEQTPNSHLGGAGCPICGTLSSNKNSKKDVQYYLKKFRKAHGDKYDYSLFTQYDSSRDKIKIICPKHLIFEQSIGGHIVGRGCLKCAIENKKPIKSNTLFIEQANLKHDNFYIYPEEYKRSKVKIRITCPEHGDFHQTPGAHLNGSGCPKCICIVSKPEIEVQEFVKSLGFEIITNKRNIIKPYELDIYLPSLNKAIEFNGTYWHYDHSNKNCKPKGYHALKSNLCRNENIKLLHIREDLWKKDKEKMKKVIINFLN